MTLTRGPLLSASASGALGPALAFSKLKRGCCLKMLRKTRQRAPSPQRANSTLFKTLSAMWEAMTAPQQATWAGYENPINLAPRQLFFQHNLNIFRENRPPQREWPAEPGTLHPITAAPITLGLYHKLRVAWNVVIVRNGWSLLTYGRRISPPTLMWSQLLDARAITSTGMQTFNVENLDPGIWYFAFATGNTHGDVPLPKTVATRTIEG